MDNKINPKLIAKAKNHISQSYTEKEQHQQPFIKLHCMQDKYDEENFKVYISIDKDFIANGGLKKMSPTALQILLVIACHTDNDGYSWISQKKIGELLGLTRQQVGKVINTSLLNKEYADRTLLKSVKFNKGENQSICVYNPVICFLEKVFLDPDYMLFQDDEYVEDSIEIIE